MLNLRGLGTINEYIAEKSRRSIASIAYDNLKDLGAEAIIQAVGGSMSPLGILFRRLLREDRAQSREMDQEQRKQWRQERLEWLQQNQWRFDWRSQPRRPAGTEAGGEWMKGRLNYMAEQKAALSRSQRQSLARHTRWVRQNKKSQSAFRSRRNIQSSWN